MNEILRSHLIDFAALRADAFDDFFGARQEALWTLIERAMGKAIQREGLPEEALPLEEELADTEMVESLAVIATT